MMKKMLLLTITACMSFMAFGQKGSYDLQVKDYISKFKEFAITEQLRCGVPAAITLAQGVVETAAGSSELCNNAQNHFGIKCKNTWTGATYAYTDDARDECFRKYESALISYRDHSDFLKNNKRYAGLFVLQSSDYKGWAHGLKKCGYATNPQYAQKLIEIIETYNLQDYTYAALGRVKDNPVILASAGPLDKQDGSVPEYNKGLAEGTGYAEDNNSEWEVVRTNSPVEQKADDVSGDYYQVTRKNGLKGFPARKGDMLLEYAIKNKIRYARLLEMNDLPDAPLEADMFIYLEKKNKAAQNPTHIVEEGETLLQISQEEGIQLQQLRLLNRLDDKEQPLPGNILNLREQAGEKPATYAEKGKNEEEVSFGYGAKPVSTNAKKADEWVETKSVREISDDTPEEPVSNIADLTAVEEDAPQAVVPAAQNGKQLSDLDRLKAKMDQSVYGNTASGTARKEEPDFEDPATVPAYTQSAQDKDPDDALRKHMRQVKEDEGDFVPKQNKDQSERVKNMPVQKSREVSSRGKRTKGKIVPQGKGKPAKGKARVAGKVKKQSSKAKAAKKAPVKGKKPVGKKKK